LYRIEQAMNLIYLTPYLPVPDSHGCAAKTWDDLSALSGRHNVHVVCFVSEDDKLKIGPVALLPNICVYPVPVNSYRKLPARSPIMTGFISELSTGGLAELLQCECSFMTRYIPRELSIPMILTEHQVYWLHFWREFRARLNPIMLVRMAKNIAEEYMWLRRFRRIMFFSQHDRACFKLLLGRGDNSCVIPLSVDCEKYSPRMQAKKKFDICFLGDFSSYANVDAVMCYLRRIHPLVLKLRPALSCVIAGGHMPGSLKKKAESAGVFCAGYVDDVCAALASSRVFINPMRLGSGMRRKVLEAWAMGIPVISTAAGAEGLDVSDRRNIIISDIGAGFAGCIDELLSNPQMIYELGKAGRISAQKRHDIKTVCEIREAVYGEIRSLK
jgi:glycosyltransferase involved in cell wall biosynthesis